MYPLRHIVTAAGMELAGASSVLVIQQLATCFSYLGSLKGWNNLTAELKMENQEKIFE